MDWERCTNCPGAVVADGHCLGHVGDDVRSALFGNLAGGLDARGVWFHEALLAQLKRALTGVPVFAGDMLFQAARFDGELSFASATFKAKAMFASAQFQDTVTFNKAVFERGAQFRGAVFSGQASFAHTTFEDDARFSEVAFEADAHFPNAEFRRRARFGEVKFGDGAWFGDAKFGGSAFFENATFAGATRFTNAVFSADASFRHGQFSGNMGALRVADGLALDFASFASRIELDVGASWVSLRRCRLPEGTVPHIRRGELALDEAEIGKPSILAPAGDDVVRVVSLRRTDLANLVLTNVDLRACRFYGAHNLDKLRFEGNVVFPSSPRARGWTRRRTLAEEHAWRFRRMSAKADAADGRRPAWLWRRWAAELRRRRAGWYESDSRPPEWLAQVAEAESLEPEQVAPLYRSLRKGREDGRDEAGAADFYYGEMEMRRAAASTPKSERSILWLYRLVSGYGLRASRAVAALVVTIALATVLLYATGLQPDDRALSTALLQSAEGATLRSGDRDVLNQTGKAIQLALRLLGPLCFGLALLSLRGRIKR